MGLNKRGAVNAPIEASGDSWACHLFSFYVTQHLEHPAGTGLPGAEEDGEGRMAEQGAGTIPVGPVWGTGPTPCWRCAPIAVPYFTHLKYPHNLHG